MKVLGINCSPRKGGNTEILLKEVFKALEKENIKTELFQIGGKRLSGCIACMKCRKKKDGFCHQKNDVINECIKKMMKADAIIIGSPVYFADITADAKALIEVAGYAMRAAGNPLKRKPAAAVIAVRRAGAIHSLHSINNFFLINEMIVVGSSYWNVGIGREKGEVLNDEEGLRTMKVLGENMAWVMKKIKDKSKKELIDTTARPQDRKTARQKKPAF